MRIEIRTGFDEEVMASELPIRKAVAKTVKMLQGMENISSLINHLGLNFENFTALLIPKQGTALFHPHHKKRKGFDMPSQRPHNCSR